METEKEVVEYMLQRQITPDRIGFGVAKLDSMKATKEIVEKIKPGDFGDDFRWKRFNWTTPIQAGGCVCFNAQATINTDGAGYFSCSLMTENPGHDSWGILRLDFCNPNVFTLYTAGQFWSPTIHSGGGDGQPWSFSFGYIDPGALFDATQWLTMTSHC